MQATTLDLDRLDDNDRTREAGGGGWTAVSAEDLARRLAATATQAASLRAELDGLRVRIADLDQQIEERSSACAEIGARLLAALAARGRGAGT